MTTGIAAAVVGWLFLVSGGGLYPAFFSFFFTSLRATLGRGDGVVAAAAIIGWLFLVRYPVPLPF